MKLKEGATLPEVVTAVALVAFCIGSILAVVAQCSDLKQSADNVCFATNIARSRIERAREVRAEQGYAAIGTLQETDTLVDSSGLASSTDGDFKRSTDIDTATYPGFTKVTVSVKYKRKGVFNPTGVALVTVLSQYDQ